MQIWNTYRNRTIGYWLQSKGINIIPNIRWGDERTYEFAFEGIEKGGTVAVGTYGCLQNKDDRYYFEKGLKELVGSLQPNTIVSYSYAPDNIFKKYKEKGINVIVIPSYFDTIKVGQV